MQHVKSNDQVVDKLRLEASQERVSATRQALSREQMRCVALKSEQNLSQWQNYNLQ
jgi:hypothetical protein